MKTSSHPYCLRSAANQKDIFNYPAPVMLKGLRLNHDSPLTPLENAFQLPPHVFIIDPVGTRCKESDNDQSHSAYTQGESLPLITPPHIQQAIIKQLKGDNTKSQSV